VVIAEHLIAEYAFGTVASVNLASKAIHNETLPVLYESFFYEDFKRMCAIQNRMLILPEAVEHTK
jgi:hypothetical protein